MERPVFRRDLFQNQIKYVGLFKNVIWCNSFFFQENQVARARNVHTYWYCGSGGSRISRRGGADLVGGAPSPEAATFRKICMSKRKNLDPWGGMPAAPPGSGNVWHKTKKALS